ncbi:helix-turn-helix transcriptional regulator [Lysinibacillus sp. MHQ-1]|nr:helix-turn-helix transcriptional regulator [Lysinibacillus sp. MHQ-1]
MVTEKMLWKKLDKSIGITISESYYGMIEQGVRTPSLEVALAISELFEMEPSQNFFYVTRQLNVVFVRRPKENLYINPLQAFNHHNLNVPIVE